MLRKMIYYIDTGLFFSVLVEELINDEKINVSEEEITEQIRTAISDGYLIEEEDGYLETSDEGWEKLTS